MGYQILGGAIFPMTPAFSRFNGQFKGHVCGQEKQSGRWPGNEARLALFKVNIVSVIIWINNFSYAHPISEHSQRTHAA